MLKSLPHKIAPYFLSLFVFKFTSKRNKVKNEGLSLGRAFPLLILVAKRWGNSVPRSILRENSRISHQQPQTNSYVQVMIGWLLNVMETRSSTAFLTRKHLPMANISEEKHHDSKSLATKLSNLHFWRFSFVENSPQSSKKPLRDCGNQGSVWVSSLPQKKHKFYCHMATS